MRAFETVEVLVRKCKYLFNQTVYIYRLIYNKTKPISRPDTTKLTH